MPDFTRMAAADFDGLIAVVVIVATLIFKGINAASKKARPKPGSAVPGVPVPRRGAVTPGQELSDFLKSLAQGMQPQPAGPPPPPLSRSITQMRKAAPQRPPPLRKPAAVQRPAPPKPAAPMAPHRAPQVARTAPGGVGLTRRLRTSRSAREAIMLREVLGPPVALRTLDEMAGTVRVGR